MWFFLGFEIARSKPDIFLTQRKYIIELLDDASYLVAKPSIDLFDPTIKLSIHEGQILEGPSSYKRLIGRLIYLTNLRLNISFVIQHLSQ